VKANEITNGEENISGIEMRRERKWLAEIEAAAFCMKARKSKKISIGSSESGERS